MRFKPRYRRGFRLEGKRSTSGLGDSRRDLRGGQSSVVVAKVRLGQSARLGGVLAVAEVVVRDSGVTGIGAVQGLLGASENVTLNKELGALAGVDAVTDVRVDII